MRSKKGFTLVELMVVILIVGILASVAVPIMRGRIDSAKWSEANAAAGSIATGIRAYAAEKGITNGTAGFQGASVNGSLTTGNAALGLANMDLDGTYFSDACYVVSGAAYDAAGLDFVITVTAASAEGTRAEPTTPATMTYTVTDSGPVAWQ
ncbi:MAG: type II secretion system protein [Planctomycetes bacterium]|nr:type II secretion system protein [Planctomycetota bacterium]